MTSRVKYIHNFAFSSFFRRENLLIKNANVDEKEKRTKEIKKATTKTAKTIKRN